MVEVSVNPGETATRERLTPNLSWVPQPGPQEALFYCNVPEIFSGGGRGGGKTDGVLGKWGHKQAKHGPNFNAIMFRPTIPSQDDIWHRARLIYLPLGGDLLEYNRSIKFPSGGRIRFRPLEREADADKYQGQNLSDIWVEEAGLYPRPNGIDKLWGALRGSEDAQFILTANPGGPGQQWIKARYIDPWRPGSRIIIRRLPNGVEHHSIFIRSVLTDNKILLERDPGYINRLYLVGSKALVKAWLDGDWDAVEGAFFDCWDANKHIISPFPIPRDWPRYMSGDWGSAVPSSFAWWAIAPEDFTTPDGHKLPKGCAIRYRELYTMQPGKPNVGTKETVEQVADRIKTAEKPDTDAKVKIKLRVIDPKCFAEDGGPSHGERFSKEGLHFAPADNTRVGRDGRMMGWDLLRARLIGHHGLPMLVSFSTCHAFNRTVPAAQHDDVKAEDLDTDTEDHALDDGRYFCAARPWLPPALKPKVDPTKPTDRYARKINDGGWKTW